MTYYRTPRVLVSSCLLGIMCRYLGDSKPSAPVRALSDSICLIPVCPEQLGGMPTPRPQHELLNGRAIAINGRDDTDAYLRGAAEVLRIARLLGCRHALLKERSPSCGTHYIYDGSFSGKRMKGMGITARVLSENGIKLYSEETIAELLHELEHSA